jgi:hypothetical protein
MKSHEPKSADDSNAHDRLILRLPAVTPESAPIDHPSPSSASAIAHALALLRSVPESVWEQRRRDMNPNRFVL